MTLGFSVEELVPRARGGGALRMGLVRLAEREWLQPEFDRGARTDAFDRWPESVMTLPEAEPAGHEVAAMLGVEGGLGGAARSVWEDLCLLLPDDSGTHRLVGGAVAFPTDWRLGEKLGLPLTEVHAPIQGYAEQLATGVDHFVANLPAGPIYGRANWFVVPTDTPRWMPNDAPESRFAHVSADNAGETLFVRCERQTIRRLPQTGAVLFTIGVHVAPLHQLSDGVVARIASAVASIGAGEHERRAAPYYAPALAAYAARLPFPTGDCSLNAVRPIEAAERWTREAIAELFDLPFTELVFRAAQIHRERFRADEVQRSTLLSIKTGGCPEDCGYCNQSAKHGTDLKASKLMDVRAVMQAAAQAKDNGSTRFCMGAAWRNPKDKDMPAIVQMVQGVRQMGMETCMTLGMLTPGQADQLAEAGLDYYNHNIDTSPEYYDEVITTRTFADRLDTLENVRTAGINVCSGGIVGMGETRGDRVGFIHALANLPCPPESVPINVLVPVKGTPLGDMLADTPLAKIDDIEFVRTVAVARITMPGSMVRLSAGRESMGEAAQALCFMAGANSIFTGDKLLTTGNAGDDADAALFAKLGLKSMAAAPTLAEEQCRC